MKNIPNIGDLNVLASCLKNLTDDPQPELFEWRDALDRCLKDISELCDDRSRDAVVEAVCDDLRGRSEVGIRKYGVTLERKDLTLEQWLRHAYEENLDFANYLRRALMEFHRVPFNPAQAGIPLVAAHEFQGRLDRPCEICNEPDRAPQHDREAIETETRRLIASHQFRGLASGPPCEICGHSYDKPWHIKR